MGAYQPLFSIAIEHAYFADHNCKSLMFYPTDASRALLANAGLILRSTECGIAVFYETDRLDILRLHAADEPTLTFKVFSKDPQFSLYTYPVVQADNSVLFFDNHAATKNKEEKQVLHKTPYVSEQSFISLDSEQLDGLLERRDLIVKPCFIIQIYLTAQQDGLCSENLAPSKRKYYIRFTSQQTYWKYFILGDLSERHLFIADLDNKIQFENLGKATLPGDRSALMLQSSVAIDMQELQNKRFQLREQGDIGEKVLIKRMPNASLNFMNGEMIDSKMENISEIYIN